jgi:DeoR family fructose operon transcriptional repressor
MIVTGEISVKMNKEREKSILSALLKNKRVSVKELAKELYASEPSIRRDLKRLEDAGIVKRTHGGAILEEQNRSYMKIPFVLRELEGSDAKIIIAKKAAEIVKNGDTVMLDASSSAYAIVPFLAEKTNVTVITSGLKALTLLCELGINAYSTGGRVLPASLSLVDSDCLDMLSNYNADVAFFSCRGISPDGMITDFSVEENLVRRKMIERSDRAYLLCTEMKMGKTYFNNICSVDDITGVISEAQIDK